MHYGNGDMYVGAWQEGETNGFGVFSWAKGEKAGASHEGHFLPGGVRVGVGKFTKENKDMYECEWLEDLPEGFGKITYNSGARYAGELKAGRISGKGLFVYADGSSYEGEWLEDERHGTGKMIYPTHDWYEGNW